MALIVTSLCYPPPYELQTKVERPVIDQTDLKDLYDFTLDWNDETGPSFFTALEEQTGLKLEPRKSLVEFVAIDHVEKPATN